MIQIYDKVQNQNFFVEAHIADIHFGVIDPAETYRILTEQFIKPLSEMQVLDIISINGDLFDHKFMASSEAVVYSIYFIQALLEICKNKNATLLLISGTGSHDADQMKLFYPYMKINDVDVRVVMTTRFEYIKGKKILCIPELYNKGEDYYNIFLLKSGYYDACYMHGTFKGGIVGKNERDLNSQREPVFDIQDFGGCLGPIISGHNHVHSTYGPQGDFFYCGSPIRWQFGEEQEKGYLLLFHNIKEHWYSIHFEPIVSYRYETITLDEIMKSDPNTIIQYIEQVKNTGIDHLRIRFTHMDRDKIALLKSYYRNRKDIVFDNDYEKRRKDLIEEKLVIYMNKKDSSSYWTLDLFNKFMEEIKKI